MKYVVRAYKTVHEAKREKHTLEAPASSAAEADRRAKTFRDMAAPGTSFPFAAVLIFKDGKPHRGWLHKRGRWNKIGS